MAKNDIYKSEQAYERFMANLEELLEQPEGPPLRGRRKYFCQNADNLIYFRRLHDHFEARDTSYIRRLRVLRFLLFITSHTGKDLRGCDRTDVDQIVAQGHKTHRTPNSKADFLKAVKAIWRILFPVLDEHGLVDAQLLARLSQVLVDRRRDHRLSPVSSGEEEIRIPVLLKGMLLQPLQKVGVRVDALQELRAFLAMLGDQPGAVLAPFLLRVPTPTLDQPLFSPRDAMAERHARARWS